MAFPKKLYVTGGPGTDLWFRYSAWKGKRYSPGDSPVDCDDHSWTISPDTGLLGWENDSGCGGYGLPKDIAEEMVKRWNAYEANNG